ncbi:hypothetical protein Hdeb2414_s0004g00149331 [Helianthus debilis subsp. tardiflorus]
MASILRSLPFCNGFLFLLRSLIVSCIFTFSFFPTSSNGNPVKLNGVLVCVLYPNRQRSQLILQISMPVKWVTGLD